MWLPFLYALVLILTFSGYLYLCTKEERRGERFVLSSLRSSADRQIDAMVRAIERLLRYIVRYVITLSWYYSLHAFLKVIMKSLAGAYHVVEAILIRNRERARALRRERRQSQKSHLTTIAEHKVETKLSPSAERKLKDKALRGD